MASNGHSYRYHVFAHRESHTAHFDLELYADGGNVMGVATTEGYAGKLLSSVPHPYRVPTLSVLREVFQLVYGGNLAFFISGRKGSRINLVWLLHFAPNGAATA